MKTYYLTGRVRGNCGHRHHSLRAAARCHNVDSRACAKQGGYSDRTLRLAGGWARDDDFFDDVREFEAWVGGEVR